MPEDVQTVDQTQIATDVVPQDQVVEPSKDSTFDNVPPELEGEYKKLKENFDTKVKEYEPFKQKAQAFDELTSNPSFQQWYISLKQPQSQTVQTQEPAKEELTDEEYLAALSDKRKFEQLLNNKLSRIANDIVVPLVQKNTQQVQILQRKSEIESFSKDNPDFWDLDDKGLIEPLLMKYPGISIEDAYRIAKFPLVEQEAINKAHGIVSMKKSAIVEKPGISNSNSKGSVKVKNREEAMQMAYQYAREGKEVPEFDIESRR